jgi:hypothetical protein
MNATGRIVLAGSSVTLAMIGAPVNIRLNPLKALAVYDSGKVAVQIICEPETSSEPSNARLPAGNSTPEVTDTGPIGPLRHGLLLARRQQTQA